MTMDERFKGHKRQFEPLNTDPDAAQVWHDDAGCIYVSFDATEVILTTAEAENLMYWIKDNLGAIDKLASRRCDGE